MTTWRKHIAVAIAVSVALRLWMVLATKDIRIFADGKLQIWGDAYFYHHSANLVAEGVGFVNPLKYNKFGIVTQAADHPPLFIAYLAVFSLLGLKSIVAHQLATGLIGIMLVVATAQLSRLAFGERVGKVALWLAVMSPLLWSWDKMLWSEPLAMLFAVLTVLVSIRTLRNATPLNVVLLGVVAGCATLSRAELLLCGLLSIGLVLLIRHRSITKSLVAGACMLAVLSPWVLFNLSRFDETVILSNGLDIVIPTDNCASTYRGQLVAYWDIACAQEAIDSAERRFPNADESVVNAEIRRIGVDFIRNNKRRAAEVVVLRELRVLGIYKPLQQIRLD
ncbi:MAG: ArnT family glycosyltransferase, partial [Actinomycetota bacterium]